MHHHTYAICIFVHLLRDNALCRADKVDIRQLRQQQVVRQAFPIMRHHTFLQEAHRVRSSQPYLFSIQIEASFRQTGRTDGKLAHTELLLSSVQRLPLLVQQTYLHLVKPRGTRFPELQLFFRDRYHSLIQYPAALYADLLLLTLHDCRPEVLSIQAVLQLEVVCVIAILQLDFDPQLYGRLV